jgi:hypothetical protein
MKNTNKNRSQVIATTRREVVAKPKKRYNKKIEEQIHFDSYMKSFLKELNISYEQ